MWSIPFFSLKKCRNYNEIFPDSSLLKPNKTVQMFTISVNFKDTKKADLILESSLDF